jgi:serine/threonine-protein kinase
LLAPEDDPTQLTVNPAPVGARMSDEITASTPIPTPGGGRDPDVPPGTVLGEYSVESRIGQGGMGTVFSAVHPLIGKRAAVKVLRRELCEDPITLERFIDEARVVNQIGHPNIVDVFAFGQLDDGRSYFVMEWLKGETLRARLDRGGMDQFEACAILKSLARALEAAHDKGVIHRDLKPDNVFLVEERDELPRVKLLDFGIAKLVRADQTVSRTATGAMIGTPQYVAPEQAKGHHIDARVDIYSLGCVAYELLTGRPPFLADNAMEMVAKHLMETPTRMSALRKGIPRELDALVSEMLAKDREQRPTLTEISVVLERVQKRPIAGDKDTGLNYAVTRMVEVSDVGRAKRRRQRWGKLGILAGGIAMGAAAFMIVSKLSQPDPVPAPTAPSAPPQVTTPAPVPTPVPVPEPTASPSSPPSPSPSPSPSLSPSPSPSPEPSPAQDSIGASPEPAHPHDRPHKVPAPQHTHKDAPHATHVTPPSHPPPPPPPPQDDKALLAPGSLDHP